MRPAFRIYILYSASSTGGLWEFTKIGGTTF